MADTYEQIPSSAATLSGFSNGRVRDMGDGTVGRVIALFAPDTVLQNAATATGNGTAMDVSDLAAVAVQVVGITTATITWEGTIDGTNWVGVPLHNANTGLASLTATADGLYGRRVAGLKQLRARISAYTGGTITATGHGYAAGDAGHIPAMLLGQTTNPGDTAVRMGTAADAMAALAALVGTLGIAMNYNGATYDREYNNQEVTLLASALRTATTQSADQTNYNGRGVAVFLNVTAASGTGGLQVSVQYKDPASGQYFTPAALPTAITSVTKKVYVWYPGVGGSGPDLTQDNSMALTRTWRVQVTHGDSSNYTYSVGACVLQ